MHTVPSSHSSHSSHSGQLAGQSEPVRIDSRRGRHVRLGAWGSVAVLAIGLAGCSGSSSPSESPSLSASAQWADSVCTSAASVQSSLDALGSDLTYDPAQGDSAVEQMKATLKGQADQVQASVNQLSTTIAAAPVDAQGSEQLKTELSNADKSFDESVQTAADAVQKAADAQTTKDFVSAAAEALIAVKAADASAESFTTNLTTAASGANSELSAAFSSAPSCQKVASPSPSQ